YSLRRPSLAVVRRLVYQPNKVDIEPVFRFFKVFRKKRMRFFYRYFQIKPQTTVLDIGGQEFNWTLMPFAPQVTIFNLAVQGERTGRFDWVIGDARKLPVA